MSSKKSKTPKEPAPPKIPKLLKAPEFFKTIFTRLSVRRIPFLYVGFGEADNEFIFGSTLEDDIIYGSSAYATGLLQVKDPERLREFQEILEPFGYQPASKTNHAFILDLRDVSSFLNKYKSASEYELEKDDHTRVWYMVNKKRKKEEGGGTIQVPKYIRDDIIAPFRFQQVIHWYTLFKDRMRATADCLCVPFTYDADPNSFVMKVPADIVAASPIKETFSGMLRNVYTRGVDFLDTKFLEKSKYPIEASECIFWCESGFAIRSAHRVLSEGFDFIIGRPNCVYLPSARTT